MTDDETAKTLTKDMIAKADDLQPVPVDVPEWDGRIYMRAMSSGEREQWFKDWTALKGGDESTQVDKLRERYLVRTLSDADGNLLFDDASMEILAAKNAVVVDRLFDKAQEINGITESKVEDAAGN